MIRRRFARKVARAFGFLAWPTLSLFSHQGSEGDSDQQAFWSDETADGLAPRFLFVFYEHSTPMQFKLLRRLFDTFNVELKPSLWRRNVVGPGVLTKAGLRCLRKRPQSETLCALQGLGMKITVLLFFEANTE